MKLKNIKKQSTEKARVDCHVKKMNQDNKRNKKHNPSKESNKTNENPFVSQEPNYVARKKLIFNTLEIILKPL